MKSCESKLPEHFHNEIYVMASVHEWTTLGMSPKRELRKRREKSEGLNVTIALVSDMTGVLCTIIYVFATQRACVDYIWESHIT